jgi:hypothetical protein
MIPESVADHRADTHTRGIKLSRHVTSMTIDDVEHYTAEEKARIIASYPAHEREARAKGVPTMGSGRVFPIAEELIAVDPFPIPDFWAQIGGLDFGVDHPFAAVNLAWDKDADCLYVTRTCRLKGEHKDGKWTGSPVFHAASIRPWGEWIPYAWPHDGLERDRQSGDTLADQYRTHHLNMLHERATHEDGTNGVEAGITEILERMQSNRFKVFKNNGEWFEDFRLYHRKSAIHADVVEAARGQHERRYVPICRTRVASCNERQQGKHD